MSSRSLGPDTRARGGRRRERRLWVWGGEHQQDKVEVVEEVEEEVCGFWVWASTAWT